MVKITGKIFKVGSSYAIRVKKALVDAEVVKEGEEVEMLLQKRKNSTSDDVIYNISSVLNTGLEALQGTFCSQIISEGVRE